jgi:hypothetical protein
VQTRSDGGELKYFDSLKEAFEYAEKHHDVWKISFNFGNERVRLVRDEEYPSQFVYVPIIS